MWIFKGFRRLFPPHDEQRKPRFKETGPNSPETGVTRATGRYGFNTSVAA